MFGEAGPLEVKEERRAQALATQTAADNSPKFDVLAEMWMKRHAAVHKRPVSLRNDAKLLRHHLNPRFGALKATAITRAMIEQMMADLSGIPIQANRVHALLRTILKFGVTNGFLGADAAAGIKHFPESDRRISVSRAQLDRLYAVIEAHRNRPGGNIVRLLVWTGCRLSEAVGAKWSEFDLERGLWERPARRNKQGQATITPLAPLAVDMLKRMRAASVADYLFPSPRNRGLPLQDIKSYWLHVRKLAGLPALRVHDLRHVHAQALLDANVPFDTIASLLGHSSTSMTEKYAHRSSAALRDAADLAARMLAPTRARGYKKGDFNDAFNRYLSRITPDQAVKVSEPLRGEAESLLSQVSLRTP